MTNILVIKPIDLKKGKRSEKSGRKALGSKMLNDYAYNCLHHDRLATKIGFPIDIESTFGYSIDKLIE